MNTSYPTRPRQSIKLIWSERMTEPAPDHFLSLLASQASVHHCWRYRHYWQTTALIRLRFFFDFHHIAIFSCLHCSTSSLSSLQRPFSANQKHIATDKIGVESRRRFNWVFADFGAMLCKESLPTRALGWSFSILKVSPLSALSGEGLVHYQVSEGLILLSSSLNNTLKPSPCCTGCHSIRYIWDPEITGSGPNFVPSRQQWCLDNGPGVKQWLQAGGASWIEGARDRGIGCEYTPQQFQYQHSIHTSGLLLIGNSPKKSTLSEKRKGLQIISNNFKSKQS